MANKTVVVQTEDKNSKKESGSSVIEAGQSKDPVSKSPEKHVNAPINSVGQKVKDGIDAKNKSYLTSDGKTMIVQMEENGQIFAGEHGKNAHWFPESILKAWSENK